jgi:hypothetical protein
VWARRTDLSGVVWNLDQQLQWLEQTCAAHYGEVAGLGIYEEAVRTGWGLGYGPIESQVLHCFIRHYRPRRIVEVGSGVSTFCELRAVERNCRESQASNELVCVEPFPRPALERLAGISLLKKPAQEVELGFFDQLECGDLLFIDSSHSVKTGSDVMFLYLEVIPRLKPGVFVHIHDITLPYSYSRNTLDHYLGWQETGLLLALLKGNPHLSVLCCLSALHYDRRAGLARILANYRPQPEVSEGLSAQRATGHFPSSIWLLTA